MCLQQRYLDPLPREQEGEHRAGRTTSYDAAGGLLYPLRLIVQPCGSTHGHLLSEWAVNETVIKRRAEESATCRGLALTFALPPARRRSAPAYRRCPAFPTRVRRGDGE